METIGKYSGSRRGIDAQNTRYGRGWYFPADSFSLDRRDLCGDRKAPGQRSMPPAGALWVFFVDLSAARPRASDS